MTRLRKTFLLIILLAGIFAKPTGFGQTNSKKEKAITHLQGAEGSYLTVEEAMKQYGLTGLSVVVFENYEVAWSRTWGHKSTERKEKIDHETAFSTASISKPITATLLVMLAEKGLIDLDTPVNNYLKRWKLKENDLTREVPVTFRHLLSHTAGTTQHGFADFYLGDDVPSLLESVQGKLPRYDQPVHVVSKPGTVWNYSGGGYSVAQMALEDHLGKTLPELAEEYLFRPLGMHHTTMYQDGHTKFLSNVAKVHNEQGEVIKTGIPICPQTAASAMWSTPTDMAKLLIELQLALAARPTKVISTKVAKRVTAVETTRGVGGWSMGWERYHRMGNRSWFSHGGANTGTGGHIYATMEDGNGIAFFGNGPNGVRIPVLDKLRNSIIKAHSWKKPNPYLARAIEIDESAQKRMVGLYISPFQELMSIEWKDGKLWMPEFAGQPTAELYRIAENSYGMDEYGLLFQYQEVEGVSSLAMVVEGVTEGPVFSLSKIADNPIRPLELFKSGKIEELKMLYANLPFPDSAKEQFINGQGYRFLQSREVEAAIATFEINVSFFPNSANAYDSLGEGYLLQGNKAKAKINYEKSLELDPSNENAKKVLKEKL